MSHIDELIKNHCPTGVEYVTLSDVADTVAGLSGKSKADFTDGNARYVSYKNIFANLAVNQESPDFVRVGSSERQNKLRLGDVLFTGSSETANEVGMSSVVTAEPSEPLYLNSFCFALRFRDSELMDPEFSKYLFRSSTVRAQIERASSGVTRINISKGRFLKVRIPVPPIKVQKEIAMILDTFSKLEAELEAELEARRKQYTFYRDQLLTFTSSEIRWATMTEICDISRGKVISKDYLRDNSGPYPVYSSQTQNNGIFGYIDTYAYDFESVTWTTDGANAGSVFYHNDEEFSITNVCGLLRVKDAEEVSAKYVYYQLGKHAKAYVNEGMGNPKLMANAMGTVRIPIPEREEQERIVLILDKFDALVNDLNSGLPAELNARRQQYEHYRDRLLTFQEAP